MTTGVIWISTTTQRGLKATKNEYTEYTLTTDRIAHYLDLMTTYARVARRVSHLATSHFTTRRKIYKFAFMRL